MIAIVNSQCEYWKREFKAKIMTKDSGFQALVLKLIHDGIRPVVQIDKDLVELQFLSTLPKKSIIVWLHSDESIDISFNKQIINLESVALILRPYHLNDPKIKNIKLSALYFLKNINHVKSKVEFAKMFFWYWRGLNLYFREKKILRMIKKKNRTTYNFPLGYTDIFCKSYLKLNKFEKDSPRSSLLAQNFEPKIQATNFLSFVGQIGQIVRIVAIRSAENTPNSKIVKRSGYGAGNYEDKNVQANGLEYVQMVLKSRFVLCPPGNISGNTFRIHESVVSRRLPVVVSHPLSDPNFISPTNHLLKEYQFHSWDQAINLFRSLSKQQYKSIQKDNFETLKNQIFNARILIEKVVNSNSSDLLDIDN